MILSEVQDRSLIKKSFFLNSLILIDWNLYPKTDQQKSVYANTQRHY